MIRKLRAGMMPPATAKSRPDPATVEAFAETLEATVDAAAAAHPSPGWRPFQRLNRAEYARAVHDLLDVDIDPSAFLPPDTVSNGFDNVADVQTFSPALMEGYLRAASRVTALALGDPDASASESSYKLPKTASQLARADGAPLGTRGGVSVVHTFPADGDYVFRMDMFAEPLGLLYGSTAKGEQLEVSIDGARAALFTIDPRMSEQKTGLSLKTPPIYVQAGPRRVTAAFIQRFEGPMNDLIAPIDHTMADTEIGTAYGITTLPHLRSLNIVGPMRVTGVSDTPGRRRVFTCRPTTPDDEAGCAAEIVRGLATQAFRGPLGDRQFARLMRFYEDGRKARNFESGIARALEAILASPQFLFRLEPPPPTAVAGQPYRLTDLELASRLSFFLWDAAPDAELLALAGRGRLGASDEALARQVKRMLADPRAEALSTRFAAQWLRLQDLDKVMPDPIQFPYYDKTLGDAFRRETELFFDSLVREDRSILDLITADYTFANERVARHYGIPNVAGSDFRRVALPGQSARHSRPGQRPDADVEPRSHVARAARQVGARSPARIAAASAAAQRAGARGDQCHRGRQGAVGASADGRAPRQSGVQLVPPGHRSDRAVARELRPDRQVAHQGRRAGGRRERRALRRHDDGRPRRAARRDPEAPGHVPAQLHAEPDDVRARPTNRGARHAVGPADHSRRRTERLSAVVVHRGRRREPGVPHERSAGRGDAHDRTALGDIGCF